jgi:hypothetical protein
VKKWLPPTVVPTKQKQLPKNNIFEHIVKILEENLTKEEVKEHMNLNEQAIRDKVVKAA